MNRQQYIENVIKDSQDRVIAKHVSQSNEIHRQLLDGETPHFEPLIGDIDNLDFSRKPLCKTSLTGLTKSDIDEVLR